MATTVKAVPTWSDVKAELAHFDRVGLLGLLKDLHGFACEGPTAVFSLIIVDLRFPCSVGTDYRDI